MHADYLLICLSLMQKSNTPFKNIGIKKAPIKIEASGDKWTRTTDSRIFSPMLYQLSYITLL